MNASPQAASKQPVTRLLLSLLLGVSTAAGSAADLPALRDATGRGRAFLVSLLDTNVGLLPEYRGAKVYWFFHDNYLAAKVLSASHPDIARTITSTMRREGVTNSGKIEMLFGEAENPLPFRQYELTNVRRAGDKLLRTEIVTGRLLSGWTNYADLLLLAALAETNAAAARAHLDAAMQMWDGKGFMDAATKHYKRYSTYKLAFALLAARKASPRTELPDAVMIKLLEAQEPSGGFVTDYDASGRKIGVANVETTCLAILGIEASQTP